MTTCTHCQEHLLTYIHDEAPPRLRRKIAAHLRTCEACYALYVRERDTAHELSQELTLFGGASKPELDTMWASIQNELTAPPTPPTHTVSYGWQRGMVLAALLVLCMLPWSLTWGELVSTSAAQRIIPVDVPESTPTITQTRAVRVVALGTSQPTEDMLPPTATSTPASAPVPGDASVR